MDVGRIVEVVTSDVALMTSDRINALTGGHGGAVFAGINAANQLTMAMLAGRSPRLDNPNAPSTALDELIRLGVDAAKAAGATPSNAALVTAMLLYLRGTRSRSGIPAANRKLGALCRLHAGAERGGVCQIPTPKMGNKISGFPAVQALYDQARRKKLTRIDSRYLPFAAFAGTAWGHSTLGEDIIMPEVARNGARAATRAMIEAYQGVGTPASPLFAAIFGAAAVAEVLHGDAAAPESYGPYHKKAQTDAIYLAGLAAVEEAGLVPEFHLLGSKRAFDAARFVADLGLILKDIGAPTVVGMLWLSDLLSCFEESGRSTCMAIGTINPPLGHTPTQFLPMVMDLLLEEELDLPTAAARFREFRSAYSFDGETALVSTYIMAQKSTELGGGPITDLWLQASREPMLEAVRGRAEQAARELESGRSLTEVVRGFEQRRQATVEQRVGAMLGQMMRRDISLRYLTIEPQARRSDPVTKKYLAFDARIDVEVTIDGKTQRIEHLLDRAVPNTVKPGLGMLKKRILAWLGRRLAKVGPGEAWMIPHSLDLGVSAGAMGALEFTYAGAVIINITVPAAVAVALGLHCASEAAEIATRAAYLSSAIPGAEERARQVGERLAQR